MLQRFKLLTTLILLIITTACATKPPLFVAPVVQPPSAEIRPINIALVLGGGGSKGLAHVGVLEIFEQHKIPIDLIVATSAGSVVGALYADNPHALTLKNKLIHLTKWDLLDFSVLEGLKGATTLRAAVRGTSLVEFLNNNLRVKNIENLKTPFVAVATDLHTNTAILLRSGPIVPAVLASSSIPPLFAPLKLYGHELVDGGVIEPVPVRIAQQFQPKIIIAVNISAPPDKEPISNMLNLLYRSLHISYYELAKMQAGLADINIHPDLYGFGMFDDHANLAIYDSGKIAAQKQMPLIKLKLRKLGILQH